VQVTCTVVQTEELYLQLLSIQNIAQNWYGLGAVVLWSDCHETSLGQTHTADSFRVSHENHSVIRSFGQGLQTYCSA